MEYPSLKFILLWWKNCLFCFIVIPLFLRRLGQSATFWFSLIHYYELWSFGSLMWAFIGSSNKLFLREKIHLTFTSMIFHSQLYTQFHIPIFICEMQKNYHSNGYLLTSYIASRNDTLIFLMRILSVLHSLEVLGMLWDVGRCRHEKMHGCTDGIRSKFSKNCGNFFKKIC